MNCELNAFLLMVQNMNSGNPDGVCCRLYGMASRASRRGHAATRKTPLDIQAPPLEVIAGTVLHSFRKMDRP